ncbi:MAG: T9SS type A sorting domain-containing protein [Candidatus Kapabacteria bacterium]|nr:T9SS type A sorting domain-containing protein [Candidatus Kapabacteria bacterium]
MRKTNNFKSGWVKQILLLVFLLASLPTMQSFAQLPNYSSYCKPNQGIPTWEWGYVYCWPAYYPIMYGYDPYYGSLVENVQIYDQSGSLIFQNHTSPNVYPDITCYKYYFPSSNIELSVGATYRFRFTFAHIYGFMAYYCYYGWSGTWFNRLFIDWNKDADFKDQNPDEWVNRPGGLYSNPSWNHTTNSWGPQCPNLDVVEYNITIPDNLEPGTTLMRVMTSIWNPYDATWPLPPTLLYGYYDPYGASACHNGVMYDYNGLGYGNYGYVYNYGEIEDYNIELLLPVKNSFPANEDLLYAGELYNGTTRTKYDENGKPYNYLYKKPFVEFYSAQKPGTQIRYEITGPLPENNSVYLALDPATNSDWINMAGLKYYEIQKATGLCAPGGNGDFMYNHGGQFVLTITVRQPGTTDKSVKVPFTVSWENDLSVYTIVSPRAVGAPDYFQYPRNLDLAVTVQFQNLGISNVTRFKATAIITDPSGNPFKTISYTYDTANGEKVLKRGDIAVVNIGTVSPVDVGYYKIVVSVQLLSGTDMDSYNDRYRRVDQPDYYFSVQWNFNGVASEIRFPKATDQVIVHRPFRPIGFVKNGGLNDLSDVVATFEYWPQSGGEHKTVQTIIKNVPSPASANYAYATFPSIIIDNAGSYHCVFKIIVPGDEYESDNTIEGDFTVKEGLSGIYTIGTMNSGQSNNFNTINEALNALYLQGLTGSVVFEFTDDTYEIASPWSDRPAFDLSSAILGLGYDASTNTTRTLTFRPSADKSATYSSVTINLRSANGKGVFFGQSLMNMNQNAIINQNIEQELIPQYAENGGFITFDGGSEKSLRFVLYSTNKYHGAAFYLGKGSHDITIKNCIVENGTDQIATNHWLPRITYNVADGFISQDDSTVTVNGIYGYSAGIVNRASHPIAQKDKSANLPLDPNYNNVITGNEIKGFGLGIISVGMGVGLDENGGFTPKYNHNNIIKDNKINRVDYAGIYVGYENNTVVEHNTIFKVKGTTGEAYGILAGIPSSGNYYGTNNINLRINSNQISNLSSGSIAVGIRGIQSQLDLIGSTGELILPNGEDNLNIYSNVIWDVKATNNNALRGGIYVASERKNDNSLDIPKVNNYFIDNLNVSNNTVIIANDSYSNFANAGIAVQNVKNSKLMNNAISLQDNKVASYAYCNSAILYMGLFPATSSLDINNNVYWVAQGATVSRFIETNANSEILEEGDLNEFPTLAQWALWTGMDENSIDNYNILNDYVISGYDPETINIKSNPIPTGSVLNNRGVRLSEVAVDLFENPRGTQNQAYDIGAIEFNGIPYVKDLQPYGIIMQNAKKEVSPSLYSDAFYYMMGRKIDFQARIYNAGASAQSQVPINITISVQNPDGTFSSYVSEQTKIPIVNPSSFADIKFNLDDEIGTEFAPKTYYELNAERQAAGLPLYTIPTIFAPMSANVTPIYKVTISVPLDQNNENNTISYDFRYFVLRSPIKLLTMSNSDKTDISGAPTKDELAIKLNNSALDKAFNDMEWYIDYTTGKFDYDYLYIDGWMPKALNFNNYNSLVLSDRDYEASGNNLTTYQMRSLRSFLESGKSGAKKNLIIASQELARLNRSGDNQIFLNQYFKLNNHYPSNPMGLNGNYDGYTVKGVSIAKNFNLKVQSTGVTGDDYPKPALLMMVNAIPNQTFIGFIYNTLEQGKNGENDTDPYPNSERIMSIATTTLQYNAIYLGVDWRHFEKPEFALRAVSDFIESNGGNLVPIELLSFDAIQAGNRVDLNWATASETNSLKFELEKADITNTSLADYVKFSEMPASGLSIDTKKYGPVNDYDVIFGHTYSYRLRMIDRDGKSLYSDAKKVTIEGQVNGINITDILPNPATDIAKFELVIENGASIDLALYDMSGRRVETLLSGNQNAGRYPINIDCKQLANGTYSLILTSGDAAITKTFQINK